MAPGCAGCPAGLVVARHHDLISDHTPTALSFAPPLPYYKHHSTRTLLLITGKEQASSPCSHDTWYKQRAHNSPGVLEP
jgi:predicted Abi (CAAX) family protease